MDPDTLLIVCVAVLCVAFLLVFLAGRALGYSSGYMDGAISVACSAISEPERFSQFLQEYEEAEDGELVLIPRWMME